MKILAISHLYPISYDHRLGIAIHKQIKKLVNQDYKVRVIAPIAWTPFPVKYMSNKWKDYSKVPKHIVWDGVEVFHPRYLVFPKALFLASSGYRLYYGIRSLVRYIYQIFPFDIIHAHNAHPDGHAGALISKEYRKPLVTTFRGTDLDITIHRNNRCFKTIQQTFKNSSRIIAPTPRLKETLYQYMGISSEVISCGIDARETLEGDSSLSKQYRGYAVLLSVSRLMRTKGVDFNLKAIAKLKARYPNLVYLIAGEGEKREEVKKLAKDLDLQDRVKFLGELPHRKVMDYMSICRIFSLPSWQETLGLVYLEAMAYGKPIIGCHGQGIDGIVTDGETGLLVKPKDVDSLVKAIDFLLSHPREAKKIGDRARKLVLENYTWKKNAEKTVKVYKEVLGER